MRDNSRFIEGCFLTYSKSSHTKNFYTGGVAETLNGEGWFLNVGPVPELQRCTDTGQSLSGADNESGHGIIRPLREVSQIFY